MATLDGFTADRMLQIEGDTVVDARTEDVGGERHLILITRGGVELDPILLPPGPTGPPGSISVSPAGGALQGNYPNPGIAAGAVNNSHIASANKDGDPTAYSMRTLGTGANQAAAGNHSHPGLVDSGWVDVTPIAGDSPFASASVNRLQYRKIGRQVHVRISKTSTAARDLSGITTDDFPNVSVIGLGSIPLVARPDSTSVVVMGRIRGSYAGLILRTDGSIQWYGGAGRNYPSGSVLEADFVFFTDN